MTGFDLCGRAGHIEKGGQKSMLVGVIKWASMSRDGMRADIIVLHSLQPCFKVSCLQDMKWGVKSTSQVACCCDIRHSPLSTLSYRWHNMTDLSCRRQDDSQVCQQHDRQCCCAVTTTGRIIFLWFCLSISSGQSQTSTISIIRLLHSLKALLSLNHTCYK